MPVVATAGASHEERRPAGTLRNGSNPATGTAGHWFFGDGMVHGIRLEAGKASWYRNRWVGTTKLDEALEATDPSTMMDPTASAANTHLLAHAGRTFHGSWDDDAALPA